MNPETKKAIKAWLALPHDRRSIEHFQSKAIHLYEILSGNELGLIASFTIASIVAKRYPKRKKKVAK